MSDVTELQIKLTPYDQSIINNYNLDQIICDLNGQLKLLSSNADQLDYLVSVGSGILCGMLDILWVGEFSLERGRKISSDKVNGFVIKTAKILGCESNELDPSVKFLEKMFPIPSDGNTSDFGGGLKHHLRDFAHHPTIVGMMFSLLSQFTCKSYGTDVNGDFLVKDVPKKSRAFIGADIPSKILYGTLIWFFHLVSDMAGSSSTVGKSGGTGIPGPILSLAKELSVLPFFKGIRVGDNSLSVFLFKLFNGTLLTQSDEDGVSLKNTVLKFDLRGELGVALELGQQAIPVIANECIVRAFYFIRRLAIEMKTKHVDSMGELRKLDWNKIKPANNPTISRMITVASGVFTTLDVSEAVLTQKFLVSINYIGVGRFAVAIGEDISWGFKARNVREIKQMYEKIKYFSYRREDGWIYEKISDDIGVDKLALTVEQTELLYNLEYHVTLNDIATTKLSIGGDGIKELKQAWLDEWKSYMEAGFSEFLQIKDARLHWYSKEEILQKIELQAPNNPWFRLVLLEALLFVPYFPLSLETNKKGETVPCKKYQKLQKIVTGFSRSNSEKYLDSIFTGNYYEKGYVKRLRVSYDKVMRELNEVLKTALTTVALTAGVAFAIALTSGAFASSIAVGLVGTNFAGLHGAVLTNACLAYLGGGAIASGGLGMAGGTAAIVGGGAVLGVCTGAGVGTAVGAASLKGKKNTILQSAKLMVSIREIFLNDEKDTMFSNSIYEKYVENIKKIENELVELRLQVDVADKEEKKLLKLEIKEAEASVEAMKIARKSMYKYISSFETGLMQ